MTQLQGLALKAATVLWLIWGAVHVLAGIMVLTSDAAGGLSAIADGVDAALLSGDYHPAIGGILNQHGWNLLWFGGATLVGGVMICRKNMTAIWVTGMVGGLADLGYLIFVDLPGYVNFVPGTIMTFISGAAIVLSFWVWLRNRSNQTSAG